MSGICFKPHEVIGLSCQFKVILTTIAETPQLSHISHLTINKSVHTSSQVVIVVLKHREKGDALTLGSES